MDEARDEGAGEEAVRVVVGGRGTEDGEDRGKVGPC